jgi:hypothetical protein
MLKNFQHYDFSFEFWQKKDEGLLFHYLTKTQAYDIEHSLLLSFLNHWLLMPKNVLYCFHRRPETVWLECGFFSKAQATESPNYLSLSSIS